jgi:aromatic-amino-acid transaminase
MQPQAGGRTGLEISMTESLFGQVEAFAGDPILSLNDAFKAHPGSRLGQGCL